MTSHRAEVEKALQFVHKTLREPQPPDPLTCRMMAAVLEHALIELGQIQELRRQRRTPRANT